MPTTETITYKDDDLDVTLTVSSATVMVGMRRTRLRMAGDKIVLIYEHG